MDSASEDQECNSKRHQETIARRAKEEEAKLMTSSDMIRTSALVAALEALADSVALAVALEAVACMTSSVEVLEISVVEASLPCKLSPPWEMLQVAPQLNPRLLSRTENA